MQRERNDKKAELFTLNTAFDSLKIKTSEGKKQIETNMRERDLLNKDVVAVEELARQKMGKEQTYKNEFKKLQNKVEGYQSESAWLQKILYGLEQDKQKYGVAASHANAKYY